MSAQPTELQARLIDLFGNPATADPTKLYGNLTVNPNGTVQVGTGLVMPDGYTHAFTPMGRNRIINGAMTVTQRATSVASINGTGLYGGPDRYWFAEIGAGAFTQSTGTIIYGGLSKPAIVQTVTTAAASYTTGNYFSGFVQKIEGIHCFDMLGQPATLSFIFNASVAGTYSVVLQDGNQANTYATTFTVSANTPTKVVITFPSLPTTLNVGANNSIGLFLWIGTLNQGTYMASTLNQWVSGNYISATGVTNWGATNGNFIAMTEVQFETGAYATPFERLNYTQIHLQCLRYYERMTAGNYGFGSQNGATLSYVLVPFLGAKRAAPSVTGSAVGTFYLYNGLGNLSVSALSWPTTTIRQALASVTHTSSGVAGGAVILEDQSGSYIEFSSEL
jgi:hypothetical protein